MDNSKKTREDLILELENLHQQITVLERRRTLTHEEELKLSIIDRAPFTMWASDRHFRIVLWSGKCEQVYGYRAHQVLGENYLELFIDEPERDASRKDCISIIDNDTMFKNFIAEDVANDGSPRYMLTNCFRIWDEEHQEWIQAELAVEIGDIGFSIKEHRTLRESGIALVAKQKRYLDLEKKDIVSRVRIAYEKKYTKIRQREERLAEFYKKLEREAHMKGEHMQKLRIDAELARLQIETIYENIISSVNATKSLTDCKSLEIVVTDFEQLTVPEFGY